jgi:hypothetical protein
LVGALIVARGFSSLAIQPEQTGSRNWTMVLPILSYHPQRLMPEAHGFSRKASLEGRSVKETYFPNRHEGIVDTIVQLSYSLHSGLIAAVRDAPSLAYKLFCEGKYKCPNL